MSHLSPARPWPAAWWCHLCENWALSGRLSQSFVLQSRSQSPARKKERKNTHSWMLAFTCYWTKSIYTKLHLLLLHLLVFNIFPWFYKRNVQNIISMFRCVKWEIIMVVKSTNRQHLTTATLCCSVFSCNCFQIGWTENKKVLRNKMCNGIRVFKS